MPPSPGTTNGLKTYDVATFSLGSLVYFSGAKHTGAVAIALLLAWQERLTGWIQPCDVVMADVMDGVSLAHCHTNNFENGEKNITR